MCPFLTISRSEALSARVASTPATAACRNWSRSWGSRGDLIPAAHESTVQLHGTLEKERMDERLRQVAAQLSLTYVIFLGEQSCGSARRPCAFEPAHGVKVSSRNVMSQTHHETAQEERALPHLQADVRHVDSGRDIRPRQLLFYGVQRGIAPRIIGQRMADLTVAMSTATSMRGSPMPDTTHHLVVQRSCRPPQGWNRRAPTTSPHPLANAERFGPPRAVQQHTSVGCGSTCDARVPRYPHRAASTAARQLRRPLRLPSSHRCQADLAWQHQRAAGDTLRPRRVGTAC